VPLDLGRERRDDRADVAAVPRFVVAAYQLYVLA
jgi:hypothetical protein